MYSPIAQSFSKTRFSIWQEVQDFLNSCNSNCKVLDAGCGNGKNMLYRKDLEMFGIDNCVELITICLEKNLNVKLGDILEIPFPDEYFDSTMSIAVVHHLKTFQERCIALQEMIRITKKGGQLFITLWKQFGLQRCTKKKIIELGNGDYLVPFGNYKRFYHICTLEEIKQMMKIIGHSNYRLFISNGNWNLYINV
jgi:ubiquinone/menaquinone biosynthesis C-methylase UbiE